MILKKTHENSHFLTSEFHSRCKNYINSSSFSFQKTQPNEMRNILVFWISTESQGTTKCSLLILIGCGFLFAINQTPTLLVFIFQINFETSKQGDFSSYDPQKKCMSFFLPFSHCDSVIAMWCFAFWPGQMRSDFLCYAFVAEMAKTKGERGATSRSQDKKACAFQIQKDSR